MREATHKFRYIIGHSKVESHPGVLAETEKVSKNIDTRIIKPSQRIAWCNNELKTLRQQGNQFSDYLNNIKRKPKLSYKTTRNQTRDDFNRDSRNTSATKSQNKSP